MYPYLGIVKPGSTIFVPFHTFDSNDPSASVTLTGLAVTDIEVYKDAGMTQRASDSGYALVDTDGIDLDTITGFHGFTIDLSDNTTAGFWAAGSDYTVVVSSVTVDAATVNFIAARFRIGYPEAILNTTIATLASQTSFTLTTGPAEDDALNGMWCVIHDVASAVQLGYAVISDYTGTTKTVTLAAGTTFTAAATDNISVIGPAPLQPTVAGRQFNVAADGDIAGNLDGTVATLTTYTGNTPQTGDSYARLGAPAGASVSADVAAVKSDSAAILLDTAEIGAAGAGLTAVPWNAAWDAEVQSEVNDGLVAFWTSPATLVDLVWDEPTAGHATAGTTGKALTDAGAAGDPWSTSLPGAYGAGTAGYIIGNNLDAAITTRASASALSTAQTDLDTITGSDGVTLATAQALYAPAKAGDAMTLTAAAVDLIYDEATSGHVTAGTYGVLFTDVLTDTGTTLPAQISGLNNLSAAQVAAELATYDGPTKAEMDAAFAALNDVSAADVNAQVDAALVDIGLDHLVAAAVIGTDVVDNSIIARLVSSSATADWDTFDNTTDSVQALRDWIGNGSNLTEAGGTGDHLTAVPFNAAWEAEIQGDVTASLNTYDPPTRAELTTDVNSVLTRLGTPVADIATDIAGVQSDTNDIQTRLPAALVGGRMDSSVGALVGNATAASNLRYSALGIVVTQATTGTLSTTQMSCDLAEITTSHYVGRSITWIDGPLAGQSSNITAYTTGLLTFSEATDAPANGNTAVIL